MCLHRGCNYYRHRGRCRRHRQPRHHHTTTHRTAEQIEPPPGHEMPSDEHDTDNSWAEEVSASYRVYHHHPALHLYLNHLHHRLLRHRHRQCRHFWLLPPRPCSLLPPQPLTPT